MKTLNKSREEDYRFQQFEVCMGCNMIPKLDLQLGDPTSGEHGSNEYSLLLFTGTLRPTFGTLQT